MILTSLTPALSQRERGETLMKFSVAIYDRDFSGTQLTPVGATFEIARYSFNVLGGPYEAAMTITGALPAISDLIQRLRCPIEIYDEAGALVWWGFIREVTASVNGWEIGASLDSMSNRVAVAYSFVDPGSATVGTRKTTAWTTDADSISEYGIKELLSSLDGATDAQAIQTRDIILSQFKYPIVTWQAAKGEGTGQILCSGWWSTLGWRMYANSGISSVETTTQISEAITDLGQFFTGVTIDTASGINCSEYQDGDSTLLTVVNDLLTRGTSAGSRLTATVDANRLVTIAAEPVFGSADYQWLDDGRVFDQYGTQIMARACPYGRWFARPDLGSVDLYQLISPLQTFIDHAEYDARTNTYKPRARGVPGPFDIAQLVRQ